MCKTFELDMGADVVILGRSGLDSRTSEQTRVGKKSVKPQCCQERFLALRPCKCEMEMSVRRTARATGVGLVGL